MCWEHHYQHFFSKFNALEMDQFRTVYDLLVDCTTHSFYDRCVCDVAWGWFSITPAMTSPYCFERDNYNGRHEQMVSRGPRCLRRMETANSKEECSWTWDNDLTQTFTALFARRASWAASLIPNRHRMLTEAPLPLGNECDLARI